MKRLLALVNLAVHFGLHCLRGVGRLFRGRPDGLALFLEHYAQDGIRLVTAEEEATQAANARCVACGLCSFALARAGRVPVNLDLPPGALASTLTRSYVFFGSAAELGEAYKAITPGSYACPTDVELVRARALLESSRPAPAAVPAAPQPAPPAG